MPPDAPPTPEDAVKALRTLVTFGAAALGLRVVAGARDCYSQREGERPPGAGKVKYLRVHRALMAAGDTEAWAEGKARLMSAAAWERGTRTRPALRLVARQAPTDVRSALLRELGAVTRR
jgi:hypothetical protein